MAEELRLALILLGTLAIGSVILHGIWTVRRTVGEERKNAQIEAKEAEPVIAPEEQEIQRLKLKQMEMNFNELQLSENPSNMDDSNVGIPVTKLNVDSIYQKEVHNETSYTPSINTKGALSSDLDIHDVQSSELEELDFAVAQQEQTTTLFENTTTDELIATATSPLEQSTEVTTDKVTKNNLYQRAEQTNTKEVKTDTKEAAQTKSLIDDVDEKEVITKSMPEPAQALDSDKVEEKNSEPEQAQEVFILYVDKSNGTPIDGARLLPLLLTLGFKFGEMGFFHRHQDNAGRGDILFSLANMFNPGTFNVDSMEQLTTRGLTIFMTLPNNAEPLPTFNMMHNAAKKIADEFSAVVLDDKRRPLNVSIVRSYVERIRRV